MTKTTIGCTICLRFFDEGQEFDSLEVSTGMISPMTCIPCKDLFMKKYEDALTGKNKDTPKQTSTTIEYHTREKTVTENDHLDGPTLLDTGELKQLVEQVRKERS